MKIYRRGLWQILNIILWSIPIVIMVGGSVFIVIDLYREFVIEYVVVLILVLIVALPFLLYGFTSLFRSYIVFGNNEITVTANVNRNTFLVYKDQNAFSLQYDKIQNISFARRTPNDAKFLRHTPYFLTLVLQTDNNNRYITLHYHSEKQICLIIDLLLDKIEQKTGNRISDKCGRELLDDFYSQQRAKSKR